nr:family 43 glycosylhydrolase [Blastocatellia bacterium]
MLAPDEVDFPTYLNPVYPKSFPDPFVLKFGGEYFAYCTGFAPDGNVFRVLRSRDLVAWTESGGAMNRLETSPPFYWAPEVTYNNGNFYLYYSVGNETLMEIRVAVSESPIGVFVDSGRRLTSEEFAIDAHVFVDDHGSAFLFYATDFLDHTHIGTGTVVDRMIDMFTLEGDPRPVTRARYDWQVYDPNRTEKGGVRWHTVEGPTVLKRKGVYYQMFSGGNWQNTSYGVSFAVSDRPRTDEEWLQLSDGDRVLPVLRTIPGVVDGPGHNSVVRGPNNRELYCIYHRWTDNERVLAIDRMDFAGDRIFVHGATSTPQPAPFEPRIKERFIGQRICDAIVTNGGWRFGDLGAVSDGLERCEMHLHVVPASFLLEVTVACIGPTVGDGIVGIEFQTPAGRTVFSLDPENRSATLTTIIADSDDTRATVYLPADFEFDAPHLLRINCDHRRLTITLDEPRYAVTHLLEQPVQRVLVFAERQPIAVRSLDLTAGFEELFEDDTPLEANGWQIANDAQYRILAGELAFSDTVFALSKGPELHDLEFAVNFRLAETSSTAGDFGLSLDHAGDEIFRIAIDREAMTLEVSGETRRGFPLPENVELA